MLLSTSTQARRKMPSNPFISMNSKHKMRNDRVQDHKELSLEWLLKSSSKDFAGDSLLDRRKISLAVAQCHKVARRFYGIYDTSLH